MTEALAKQEPWWTPGEQHGYHQLTYGWLVGEVAPDRRAIDGAYWREEFAAPLGLDAHIGTGPEFDGRISTLINAPVDPDAPNLLEMRCRRTASAPCHSRILRSSVQTKSTSPPDEPGAPPRFPPPRPRQAWPRVYGGAANGGEIDGIHVINPETLENAIVEQSNGPDTP